MPEATLNPSIHEDNDQVALAFYRNVLHVLNDAGIPFLVGGAYALSYYTGVSRNTKDLDIFICREHYERINDAFAKHGYETEMAYPHWLAKIRYAGDLVDLIFSSGNGVSEVDDAWFENAPVTEVLNIPVRICPVEESIWSKAFIMERERYDGADVAHMIRACGQTLNWQHLVDRFSSHWRVLLSHLTLFGLIYPSHRDVIPSWVMTNLLDRLREESLAPAPKEPICGGTLLSREQYLVDVEEQGYKDARVIPFGNMSSTDTQTWTEAIQKKDEH